MSRGPEFTGLTEGLTNCHRSAPALSHGVPVCPDCGAVVAGIPTGAVWSGEEGWKARDTVAAALRAAGVTAHHEHPGYVGIYAPDGRYLATGLEGWDRADLCAADGDALSDESVPTGLPYAPATVAETVAALLTLTLSTFGPESVS